MKGKISSRLLDLIHRQINQNGIVVWYDPQGNYRSFVESLPAEDLPGIPLVQYDGSFLALRHRIEPLLSAEERPKLLIYIPLKRVDTKNAMVEAEAAGVIIAPGAQPPNRNTKLSVVAKSVLKECCSAEKLRKIEKEVEEGKLSLAELDGIAEDRTAVNGSVLEIIFKTKVPGEMALLFSLVLAMMRSYSKEEHCKIYSASYVRSSSCPTGRKANLTTSDKD